MANTFKNAYYDVTASLLPAYTAPSSAGNVAIVLTLRITNVDGANDATVDATVTDASSGESYVAYTMTVPADSSIELAGTSKLVLEAGDIIKLKANTASDLEAFISVLEIT
jgi:hypothetical protein|tara:strand:+ start:19 stop:351 length:333 start_codon:yes stop_codon:yes gene_type:complete